MIFSHVTTVQTAAQVNGRVLVILQHQLDCISRVTG